MKKGYFITGTDTGVGKTRFAVTLIHLLRAQGKKVAAMKPVASGGNYVNGNLRNNDAQMLLEACGIDIPYELVNPYVFEAPVAPHLAAQENQVNISIPYIMDSYRQLASEVDVVVIEGAGGWLTPLNDHQTFADLAQKLKFPIVLVVGMRLGCINHTLLTFQAIQYSKIKCQGWVANCIKTEMNRLQENIDTLESLLPVPLLSQINFDQPQTDIFNTLNNKKFFKKLK